MQGKENNQMRVEIPDKIRESAQKEWDTIRELLTDYLMEEKGTRTLLLRRAEDFSGRSFGASSRARKEVILNARRVIRAAGITNNRDEILRNPNGILGLRDIFYAMTEALDPREDEERRLAEAKENVTIQPGHRDMSKWPSDHKIEEAILQPREQSNIEWDSERDSIEGRETGTFTLTSGYGDEKAVEAIAGEEVWDPTNQGLVTRIAMEQDDGTYKVLIDIRDCRAWQITRFMEEGRDILRLQAPEAPAVWQAAWCKTGVNTEGRGAIRAQGQETPLSNKLVFSDVRARVINATSRRQKRDREEESDNESGAQTSQEEDPKPKVVLTQAEGVSARRGLGAELDQQEEESIPRASEGSASAGSLPEALQSQGQKKLILGSIDFECGDPGSERAGISAVPTEGGLVLVDVETGEVVGHGHGLFYEPNLPANKVDQSRYATWAVTGIPPATFVEVDTGEVPMDYQHTVRMAS
ncbi:hypothetical protein J8273_6918 [Carpediemonas membranifera]|uniref:Uncharacterized protein n=1 Tax=Carpediemonas membranifera TaxID=201153 RepID=A0A8J6E1I6_9EUKA|nr:hypothetical protein J8273_6918 [Carpediemonas membranifera]|eukprot:KAG9390682.1 hypothetical protein J8273_6918 [Carpediemonas membranifera]